MGPDQQVPIVGIKWTETVSKSSPLITEKQEPGKPCLVLEQLDEHGKAGGARLFVDRHLYAWRIAEDGSVLGAADLS